jgi:murein DD-endopeptidase MepM/ murein hydrolase activator NlpD
MGLFIKRNFVKIVIFLFVIILARFFIFRLGEELNIQTTLEENPLLEKQLDEIPIEVPELKKPSLEILLSSTESEQGDTLVITAKNVPEDKKITGKFNSKSFDFFPVDSEGKWMAFLGIDAKKAPGEYFLSVFLAGELEVEKTIIVKKKDFYITKIVITPELEEKGFTSSNISENISTKDGVIIYEVLGEYSPITYFKRNFIYPLDEIINVGAFGNIRKDGDVTIQHLGVDLDAVEGTQVYAINDGKVALVEELTVYGNTIIIDHGLGIYSLYLHLSEFKVSEGKMVKRGELIGLSGNTGWSVGPHLHFSIKLNGSSVDPLIFIREINKFLR